MLKKLLWGLSGLVVALLVAGVLAGIKMLQFRAMAEAKAGEVLPPQPVNATDARVQEWHPRIGAVGSVVAVQGTMVSTETEGVVRAIPFEAGAVVEAGAVLVQLDADEEQAQLAAAEAAAELARLSFSRAQELRANRTIAQAELDTATANAKQSAAQLENLRAVIAKKTIRAPFAGRLGIRRISVGQYLSKGSPLVSLQSLDPVFVEFSLPQHHVGEVVEGLSVRVTTNAYKDLRFEGRITASNPDVDPVTRTVRVQATLGNADRRLRPGMFVSVDMVLSRLERVTLIPASAVLPAPYGDSVFLVEEGAAAPGDPRPLVVRQQFVRLGERRGDFVVVTEGVKPGDMVVSTAPFRLRPGMPVIISQELEPEFSLEPDVKNT